MGEILYIYIYIYIYIHTHTHNIHSLCIHSLCIPTTLKNYIQQIFSRLFKGCKVSESKRTTEQS